MKLWEPIAKLLYGKLYHIYHRINIIWVNINCHFIGNFKKERLLSQTAHPHCHRLSSYCHIYEAHFNHCGTLLSLRSSVSMEIIKDASKLLSLASRESDQLLSWLPVRYVRVISLSQESCRQKIRGPCKRAKRSWESQVNCNFAPGKPSIQSATPKWVVTESARLMGSSRG